MGAGKEAPGGGEGAAEQPQPVVLKMVLHCAGCAKKVRKSIKGMPGVQAVVTDVAANRVVVAGTADAAALKARIESRTKKPVEIVSAGAGAGPAKPPAAPAGAEKKSPDKEGDKKNPDKGSGGADKGDKPGSSKPQPPKEEDTAKKQPPTPTEEKKPTELQETTALLRIRLHCDGCADRIRRRIYKIKGVKDVVMEGNAKDEVKVTGTMDVPAMVAYLTEKLNRAVEAVAPGKKDKGGGDEKKDKGAGAGDGEKKKDKGAGGDHVIMSQDKGKGIEVAGPSMASAAASMAPAPVQARTHHVSPYGQVPYPQPQGPPPSYYSPYGGNADGAGYAGAGGYYPQQHPSANPGGYYQQQHPSADAGGYYPQPREAGSYYQQQHPSSGGYYQQENPNPQAYQPYPPPYHFDTAPPPQMFSDENPNSCSVM